MVVTPFPAPGAGDPLDPRLRRAAALVLGAMRKPVEVRAYAAQLAQAAGVSPGIPYEDMRQGDRLGALAEARDLIAAVLEEG